MGESAATPRLWSGMSFQGYQFKLADSADEIEQIQRLVYRTFVVEIKQHPDPGEDRLIDKFHHKNRHLVAIRDGRLCGMVAVHDQPPFSVADAIPAPGLLERLCPDLLEVVSFRQACMNIFGGRGIVGCRSGSLPSGFQR